ncbi:MAG: hypothetical protein WBY44_11755 [Bryobacteraceae bacterium]
MRYYDDQEGMATLKLALASMNVDDLKGLVALTGEKTPTRKDDITTLLMKYLAGDRLRSVWDRLDDLQRAAVSEVVHSPTSYFDAGRFRAKYGADPNWGSGDRYRRNQKPSALCFFIYGGRAMPDDIKTRLSAFVPKPRKTTITVLEQLPAVYGIPFSRWNAATRVQEEGTEDVPLTAHETERSAQRELLSVLRLVDAGKLAVSDKTRRASSSTIEAITAILDRGDYYPRTPVENEWADENAGPIRAFAWPMLIQAGGLAQLSGSRLQLTKAGRKALSDPAAQTIRALWKKWLDTTLIDELARIECVKGQTGKGKRGLTAVSSRREAIAESLAECPAGVWISADEFERYMQATGNDFYVTRDAWDLYICDQQYGSFGYEGYEGFLDRGYLLSVLLEYAATLGMIDVALIPPAGARRDFRNMWGTDELAFFSRYDGLMYFRLTPLGAYCLGVESDYQPAPMEVKPVLQVLENLEIEATGSELDLSDRLALDTYAVAVSDLVWRLDAVKLLAAIEAGARIDEVREFLAARGGPAIPETVTRLLDDVAERTTKFQDRGLARLIECADATLAATIAHDARIRKHCLRAGEKHLVVTASSEAAFRRALREAGYLLAEGNHRPQRRGGKAK